MLISSTVIWLIVAMLLGILELMLGTFYLLVLAVASGIGALVAYFHVALEWQVVVFASVAVIGSVWVRRLRSLRMTDDEQSQKLQNLDEGQTVDVIKWEAKGFTTVQYRGAKWSAVAYDVNRLENGLHRIIEVRGNTLILQKI